MDMNYLMIAGVFGFIVGLIFGTVSFGMMLLRYHTFFYKNIWIEVDPEYRANIFDLLKGHYNFEIYEFPVGLSKEINGFKVVPEKVYFRFTIRRFVDEHYRDAELLMNRIVETIKKNDMNVLSCKLC